MIFSKTKKDIEIEYNISSSTVSNWIRTGIAKPPKNGKFYTKNEYDKIQFLIEKEFDKLKGRANRSKIDKKYLCFLGIVDEERKKLLVKTIEIHKNSGLSIEQSVFSLSLIFLINSGLVSGNVFIYPVTPLDYFLKKWSDEINFNPENKLYSVLNYINKDDDFIGAFYQSLLNIAEKSKLGSYYTPGGLIKDIKTNVNNTIIDPCCGSGSILIKILSKKHKQENVYANDIDKIALNICCVNLSMFFNNPFIKFNLSSRNFLFDKHLDREPGSKLKCDLIITNPPWGSKLSRNEKNEIIKRYKHLSSTESFSICLYNSINNLSEKGKLVFFLPYSFLNVSTHKNIRKYLIEKKKYMEIKLLGNAFPYVMSEAVRLIFDNNKPSDFLEIFKKNGEKNRTIYNNIIEPDFIIPAMSGNKDKTIIDKMYSLKHFSLKDNAVFALGIVTGNNKKYVKYQKENNTEPIYRGKDLLPFLFRDPKCFIELSPTSFQQIAPVDYYRQRKIVYKFISNNIICAIDDERRLILNSANFFIPKISYPMETIVCLFNSTLYSFLFQKKYYSKKVLRSHIESFPLPELSDSIHSSFDYIYKKIIDGKEKYIDDLNNMVYSIFQLNNTEASHINPILNK